MFEKIDERNKRIDLNRASPDPAKRDEVKGLRTVGIATQHRILATQRAAYNWAMRRGIVATTATAGRWSEVSRDRSALHQRHLYTTVLPSLAFDAAEKAAASVPRQRHLKAVS